MSTVEELKDNLQLLHENKGLMVGRESHLKALQKRGPQNSPAGLGYIRSIIQPLADSIDDWKGRSLKKSTMAPHVVPYITDVKPLELAYLTLRTALSPTTINSTFVSACYNLGSYVEEHCRWSNLVKGSYGVPAKVYASKMRENLGSATEVHRRRVIRHTLKKLHAGEGWPREIKVQMGAQLFLRLTGVSEGAFYIQDVGKGRKSRRALCVTNDFLDRIDQQNLQVVDHLGPVMYPMLQEPTDWDAPDAGGFMTYPLKLIKYERRLGGAGLDLQDMPQVYEAVNALQRVPWRINTKVLQVLQHCWDNREQLGGLPPVDQEPLPAKPVDIETNQDARNQWKRSAALVYGSRVAQVSQRITLMNQLNLAKDLQEHSKFYFVYQMDWRGRLYPATAFLSPQDDDRGRSLLQFARGKPLGTTGAQWLAIQLANSYGYDKVSLVDRVAWVLKNSDAILDSASDPLDGQRFWTTADKPWAFLAACFEWLGYCTEGADYVSRLPIHVDGSCNGLQHFAAMLLEPVSAAMVNLVPSTEPSDVYSAVAAKVTTILQESKDPSALSLLGVYDGQIPRKLVKRPVMTIPYGVTQHGIQKQLLGELQKDGKMGKDPKKPAGVLADAVQQALGSVLGAAESAMQWLQSVAKIVAAEGKAIEWVTPVGLTVRQEYFDITGGRVEVYVGGVRTQLRTISDLDTINKRKQSSGISPNYVHSMDAAHLMLTVLECQVRGVHTFGAVHDSYATLAADVTELNSALRGCFVKMYQHNWLQIFHQELQEQFPHLELPPPPSQGDFDITQVLESTYFFA